MKNELKDLWEDFCGGLKKGTVLIAIIAVLSFFLSPNPLVIVWVAGIVIGFIVVKTMFFLLLTVGIRGVPLLVIETFKGLGKLFMKLVTFIRLKS